MELKAVLIQILLRMHVHSGDRAAVVGPSDCGTVQRSSKIILLENHVRGKTLVKRIVEVDEQTLVRYAGMEVPT